MTFSIAKDPQERDSFGNYEYRILKDDLFFAVYWHDFRGDDSGLKLATGQEFGWPLDNVSNFLEGGGLQPVILSKKAQYYLNGLCNS